MKRFKAFANSLNYTDVVITFNWDVLLEKALDEIKKDWLYGVSSVCLSVLKLHGSINWVSLPENVAPVDWSFYGRIGERLIFYKGFEVFDPFTPLNEGPYIIPPSRVKRYEEKDIRKFWSNAYEFLSAQATEINVIGYSFPEQDLIARHLMAVAAINNPKIRNAELPIRIINPDERIKERISSFLNREIEFIPLAFEDYIEGQY